MNSSERLTYFKGRWPDHEVPVGEPEWLLYEVSYIRDAVLRSVEIFADGRIARNSTELEEWKGDRCPSLIDCSLDDLFPNPRLTEISRAEFEEKWNKGGDTRFWFTG